MYKRRSTKLIKEEALERGCKLPTHTHTKIGGWAKGEREKESSEPPTLLGRSNVRTSCWAKLFFSLSLSSVYCVCSCTLFLLLLHLLQFFFSYFIHKKKKRSNFTFKKEKKKSNKERKIIIIAVVRESISQHWYSMSTHKKKRGLEKIRLPSD